MTGLANSQLFLMPNYCAFFALLGALSCQPQQQPALLPARSTVPVEHVVATKDQLARRAQSEAYCRALNWLIHYAGQAWDDVPTDT
jgi:hypothetical protein